MLDNFRLVGINIKEYFGDLAVLFFVGLIVSPLYVWLNVLVHHLLRLSLDYDIYPLSSLFLKIFLWILIFLILRWAWPGIVTGLTKIFKGRYSFDSQKKDQVLTLGKFRKDWIFQGNCFPYKGGLFVSNANSGCLVRKRFFGFGRVWKDVEVDLDVDFPSLTDMRFEKRIGIILQAQNFEDYILLEFYKDRDLLKFRPHVRFQGNWDAPIFDIDKNMLSLKKDSFSLKIVVKNETIKVYLNGKKRESFLWLIPTHIEPLLRQHEVGNVPPAAKTFKDLITEMYFRKRAGMIGFRCFGNQYAHIKSLNVSRI